MTSEKGRLLDALADREEEMKEAEEIHRTEKELIVLQLRELVSAAEEERRWKTEAEAVKRENELMKKKVEVMEKEHELTIGEVKDEAERAKDERKQLQEKLNEAVLELQRQQDPPEADEYKPPVKHVDAVKDDLSLIAATEEAPQALAPLIIPTASPAAVVSPTHLYNPTGYDAGLPESTGGNGWQIPAMPSPSHAHPSLLKRGHFRLQSQTMKKGDLAHPLSLHPHLHTREDSTIHLTTSLTDLDDPSKVSTLTSALSKKVSQYLALREAYCNANDHIAMLEMALQDANERIKEVSEGQRGRIEGLEKKLAEAEGVCQRLLVLEKSRRGSGGMREMRDLTLAALAGAGGERVGEGGMGALSSCLCRVRMEKRRPG